MLALRSCAYSMYTCIYAIYAVANITIDPAKVTSSSNRLPLSCSLRSKCLEVTLGFTAMFEGMPYGACCYYNILFPHHSQCSGTVAEE